MAQLSKRIVPKDVQEEISSILLKALNSCRDEYSIGEFLDDLLTHTEKIMLAKRAGIAFMLMKGYNYHAINTILKVSNPTIWEVKSWFYTKGNGFRKILGILIKSDEWNAKWEKIDHIITSILFPTPGKGVDWSSARRRQWEARRRSQKPF